MHMIQLFLNWLRSIVSRSSQPKYYSFSHHQISPDAFGLGAREVVEVLAREGFEAYVVGGAVRDLLLGLQPKDFDVATNATPEQVKRCFRRAFIVGRRFRLVHVSVHREIIEVSTFRSEAGTTDAEGKLVSDNVYGSLAEDASRRDFSVNALYYDFKNQRVIDYHQGVLDIKRKQLRLIGHPEVRYREDPVRILRAIRLAQKLQLEIETSALESIHELSSLLQSIPPARLLDEIEKIFNAGHAADTFFMLQQSGVLRHLWGALDETISNADHAYFIRTALADTDLRQRETRGISIPFVFAILMWPQFKKYLAFKQLEELKLDLFLSGIESFLEDQKQMGIAIPRRYVGAIKELWQLQIRFLQRVGQRPYRFIHHPRFRVALDFLDLCERCEKTESSLAGWWRQFYAGSEALREQLIAGSLVSASNKVSKRRRVRSRKVRKNEGIHQDSGDASGDLS
jgi:poly(A) polymerase